MYKQKSKKCAAIAISMLMATSMFGVAEVSQIYRGTTASAITAVAEDANTIGVGVDNQATDVHVTNSASATLTIENVAAGRYFLTVAVTQSLGDFSYIVSAQIDGGAPFDLRNDYYNGTLVGIVDLPSDAHSVTLSARPMYTEGSLGVDLTLNAYFAPYAINGTNYVTGIPVSSSSPAVLAINNLASGKYVLNVSVAEQTGELPVVLNAQLNDGSVTPLAYTVGAGAYTAVLDVTEATTSLTVSSTGTNSYIVDIHFVPYVLNEANSWYLAGVRIAKDADAAIPIQNVAAANYLVTVDLGGEDVTTGDVSISATVNGGTAVLLEKDDNYANAYTGSVPMTASSTTLTISTTYTSTLIVTVSMVEEVVISALPIDTDTTLTQYNTVTYSYLNKVAGYYAIAVTNVDVPKAGFDIVLKPELESFDEISIHGNNFPTYLEANTTYYYQITYTGVDDPEAEEPPVSPKTATVKFAVNSWENKPITADDYYYVPVTQEKAQRQVDLSFDSTVSSGNYTLSLFDIPVYMAMYGATVTLHYGTQTKTLTPNNSYSDTITIDKDQSFYLTTDYETEVTLGLIITAESTQTDVLNLYSNNSVTLAAGESKTYFVENIGAGDYTVNISGITVPTIEVQSSTSESAIIAEGAVSGSFTHILTGDASVATVALILTNKGDNAQTFTITVTPDNTAGIGVTQSLNLRVNYAHSNYMELAAGAYQVALGNVPEDKEVRVYANGVQVTLDADNTGVIPVGQSGHVCVSYIYYDEAAGIDSQETISITATVTALPTMPLEADTEITVGAGESVDYYVVAPDGTYTVELLDYEGNQLTVAADGTVVLSAGQTTGNFTVENGFVKLTFNNSGDTAITVTVLVYAD